MLIESLTILDYSEKKGTRFDFSNGTNLIVSNGNKKGKSSLLKSIYYALGFDIKHFPSGWNKISGILYCCFSNIYMYFENGGDAL